MLNSQTRELAIHNYLSGLDNGNLRLVGEVLELALKDKELARIIEQIDLNYQQELWLTEKPNLPSQPPFKVIG